MFSRDSMHMKRLLQGETCWNFPAMRQGRGNQFESSVIAMGYYTMNFLPAQHWKSSGKTQAGVLHPVFPLDIFSGKYDNVDSGMFLPEKHRSRRAFCPVLPVIEVERTDENEL